jgi:hypothetical protein
MTKKSRSGKMPSGKSGPEEGSEMPGRAGMAPDDALTDEESGGQAGEPSADMPGSSDDMLGDLEPTPNDSMPSGDGDMDSGQLPPDREETETPAVLRCATMDVHRRLLGEVPGYAERRDFLENISLEYQTGIRETERAGVVRIPTVVHVVWNTQAQNVSDAQIQGQIDVLNRDFRGTNTDISLTPAVWNNLIGDANVEFYLADKDPNGAASNGITRRQTTVASFTHDDRVKSAATGGQDPWPSNRFLNMWVAPLAGGLLGYAQFPGGPAATDGVVITYTGFGTGGTAAAPFDRGRTATHEIGHWLNLYHIWGDDGTGCSGSDQVDDTPNQAGYNTGCPTFPHVTCNNGPNGDMFVNYMDYTDDRCMVMFTKGQVARMEACLQVSRPDFLSVSAQTARPSGPVVAWGANRLDAFVVGTNRALYHKWWNGSSWGPSLTGYEAMGGVIVDRPEVVAWGPNRLDAFVIGTDSALYHKWWNGSSWGPSVTGYEAMGGVIQGTPKVVSWGPNRLDVFVIGTDRALYHKWWDGTAWRPSLTGYEYMGGTIVGSPEAVSWGPNRIDIFVLGTDRALYHKWWNGSSWGPSLTGYEYMGGTIQEQPKAVAWGPNRLDVFVTGTDSALYHKWWNGSSWGPSLTGYEHMGGVCSSPPEAVSWSANRLDVFVLGTNSALYHKWWNGSSWGPSLTGYEHMGGVCTSPPRTVAWGPNRLDVFVTGTDSALYHKWWNGSSWGPSATGYERMGGGIVYF